MSDTKDTPEWMTDDWPRLQSDTHDVRGVMAREILRLRAELAERDALRGRLDGVTRHRDDLLVLSARDSQIMAATGIKATLMCDAIPLLAAERDAARAEVETCKAKRAEWERIASQRGHRLEQIATVLRSEKTALGFDPVCGNEILDASLLMRERAEKAERELDAAIRDRNEFAASEVDRVHADWLRLVADRGAWACGTVDAFFAARAAELRKAAGAATPVGWEKPGTEHWTPDGGIVATPAADARQPAANPRQSALMECATCAGVWDLSQTVSPAIAETFPLAIANKVADLAARLAASEKAKRELLRLVRDAREAIEAVLPTEVEPPAKIHRLWRRVISEHRRMVNAERAGGAS